MKGNPKVIEILNEGLCAELTAINQYVIHGAMRKNWGYNKLAAKNHEESIEEMKHAQRLIDRILFLEGVPNMQKYKKIEVGADIKEQMQLELNGELEAVALYNNGVKICMEAADNGTAEIFKQLLADEEGHVDWLETQVGLIDSLGVQQYLAQNL